MNRITSLVLAGSGLLKKHSPAILTGVAVVGVVTTTVMAAKAAQRSKTIVDQYVDQDAEQPVETPDILTKAKLTWKIWLPTVSSGAMTITAIVMANRIQSKRLALAIGAYSLAEAALNEDARNRDRAAYPNISSLTNNPRENGAVRRASMDLTRKLADLRAGR